MGKLQIVFLLFFSFDVYCWTNPDTPEDFKSLHYPCFDHNSACKSWADFGYCKRMRWIRRYCGESCRSCKHPVTCKDGRIMNHDEKLEHGQNALTNGESMHNKAGKGSCGSPLVHEKIVMNGVSEPPFLESKHHVTLAMKKKPTKSKLDEIGKCSGSLIRENVVLTCAHCLNNTEESGWLVYAGFKGSMEIVTGESKKVASFVIPRSYPSRISWDLGLVFLEEPFVANENIATIPLITADQLTVKNREWRNCQFSGTGEILAADGKTCESTTLKKYAKGILIARDCCEAVRPLFNNEFDSNVPYPIDIGCFRGASQMGCSGDSGAGISCSRPNLVMGPDSSGSMDEKHMIIGIHRGGAPCCVTDKETGLRKVVNQPVEKVIVRLDKPRLDWIEHQIAAYSLGDLPPAPAPQ